MVSSTNHGLVGSWRAAWRWRDRELFVIIEDDAEVIINNNDEDDAELIINNNKDRVQHVCSACV